MSDSADGASESASKKSAKFNKNPVAEECLFHQSTVQIAAEEASAAEESPKKRHKVVSEDEKAAIKAKTDAAKAEKAAEKARKEAERQAEKAEKEKLARQKKAVNEEKKMQKQKIAKKKNQDGTGKVGNVEDAQGRKRGRT